MSRIQWWRTASLASLALLVTAGVSGCDLLKGVVPGEMETTGETSTSGDAGAGVPLPQPYDYPPEDGIVTNAGFERGLSGWEVWDQRPQGSPGDNLIEPARDQERGEGVLRIARTSQRDGGASGVVQTLSYDCSSAGSLWITCKGYITREEGGNIANRDPKRYPEGGAQVRLKYLDATGAEHEWYHGLYITETAGADTEHFTKVPDNSWTHYVSPDLMDLDPRPAKLAEVRFYGFGWGFDAMLDDCQIVTGE